MSKKLNVILVAGLLLGLALPLAAQGNPRSATSVLIDGKTVSIEYGQPSLKGRTIQDMLGKLPAGQFWRLGADKSTTFTTDADLKFGSETVPKGVYSLWAQKQSDSSWKLVFNKQHGQWGTQHSPAQDLVSVPLTESTAPNSAEMVTITLEKAGNGGKIIIQWGDMQLETEFAPK
jgi:Protein of unknown function (DUF2911)